MQHSSLSLVFVAGNQVEDHLAPQYEKMYQHWHSIWSETFHALHPGQPFFSDQFTRQDEIMGLFDGDQCISVCCHRIVDLSLSSFRKDSYFEVWSEEALKLLCRDGDQIVVDNQISVAPAYRKIQAEFKIIELMSYLSFRHLSNLPVAGVTAASRNTRSMDSVFEKFRPTKLAQNVMYHGEPTSLYALYPSTMTFEDLPRPLREIGDRLLLRSKRSKLIHSIFETQNGGFHVNKAA